MTISSFVQEYLPEIKEPTVRNRIKKENFILEKIGAISRKKLLAQYRVSIIDAPLLKKFLLLGNVEKAMNLKDILKQVNLEAQEDKIMHFIITNKEELIRTNIIDEKIKIKKIHKLLEKYFSEHES